jgi:hypothetical protein
VSSKKVDLVIGCPIFQRAWILPEWFDCLTKQKYWKTTEMELVFAITDGEDNTREIIKNHTSLFKDITLLDCNDLPAFANRDQGRFVPLVSLRNRILEFLRERQPTHYFSYDSDIIIPNNTIQQLLKDNKDIVGPYVDLVPPSDIPNCASKGARDSFMRRKPYFQWYPKDDFYPVDTIFAVFMMKNKVFNECNYQWHSGGEDYGWGLDILEKGFESWMDSRLLGAHIYNKF